jgi:DNA-binding beta-propeller fold protein YncE
MSEFSAKHGALPGFLCIGVWVLVSGGCGREQAPAPPAEPLAEAAVTAPAETAEAYALVKTRDSGVQGLSGIALDARDNLYAAGARGVKVSSPDGKLLREWPTSGPATCVALDEDGNVYVGQRAKVETFDPQGKPLRAWGKEGRGVGELGYVTAIAVFKTNVLVADAGNRCIHRFDATGDFIDEIGKRNPEAGLPGLICPSPCLDLAVDKAGDIYVTNPGLWRVERYSLDGTLLGFWGAGGTQPQQFCGCCNPTHVALRADDGIVTAEKITARVKVYDPKGAMLAFLGPQYFTREAAGLDVAVDSADRLFVMDPGDGRIRVFERKR